ncbi:ganglioside-induced differentiation-associated protein 1 isoform X2 [Halyomorpha halys]|nr:ganglioside-induced differentiation-associated protein 1-like isoform X2 [Halyomorpha halys]
MASGEGAVPEQNDKEILLYLHNHSFYSQKLLFVLNERGIKFKTVFINIAAGDQYKNSFLDINPRGEVPVIKDGETIVVDSAKIIYYLEEQYKTHKTLIPTAEGAEIIERHNHFHTVIHDLPADVITIGSFYHPEVVRDPKLPFILPVRKHMRNVTEKIPAKLKDIASKEAKYAEVLNQKATKIENDLEIMKNKEEFLKVLDTVDGVLQEVEEQLVKNEGTEKWLVSDNFTLADIDLAILLERLYVLGLEQRFWQNRPNITKYFNRMKQRDSFKKSIPSAFFHIKTLLEGIPNFLLSLM